MTFDALRKPYQDMRAFLVEKKEIAIKCFVFNNANLKRLKKLDDIQVSDVDYKRQQCIVNKIFANIQETCATLERINIITKEDYTFSMVMDKCRINAMSEEVLRHTQNFYILSQESINDGIVADRYLEDIEQLHFLLNKFISLIVENYNICIDRIDENLKDLTDDCEK